MDSQDQSPDLSGVVDSVMQLFGEVMSRDAVCAIVEHCGGDMTQAIDVIVNMSEDKASSVSKQTNSLLPNTSQTNQPASNDSIGSSPVELNLQDTISMPKSPPTYAWASQSKGAFPKQLPNQKPINTHTNISTLQVQQIVGYHSLGSRTLILLRGLPGSGKSFLAKKLLQMMCPGTNYKTHVFSTDDFFMHRGRYEYNKNMIPEAHVWNQNRVGEAIGRGISPIFVDNTNVEIWEMEAYVKAGVNNGYIIEVLEPNTPWAKKVNQLARKNSHDVPIHSIKRMLNCFQNRVSGVSLIRSFGLSYPANKVPPVIRNYPPFSNPDKRQEDQSKESAREQARESQQVQEQPSTISQTDDASKLAHVTSSQAHIGAIETRPLSVEANEFIPQCLTINPYTETTVQIQEETVCPISSRSTITTNDTEIQPIEDNTPDDKVKCVKLEDLQKQIEQIEKIEEEWEKCEGWEESKVTVNPLIENASVFTPKPPRKTEIEPDSDRLLPSASNYNDWSKMTMFMPALNECQQANLMNAPTVQVETATTGTSVEFGDTDVNNKNLKVLIATPRDINFYYMGLNEEKIPDKRMLDKSSMTNDHDHIAVESVRCKNEEKHFDAFRKLFKNISKVELRDIFDKCFGDVNWAVGIVLDGMDSNQLHTVVSEDISDTEDFDGEQCPCVEKYNIIPNVNAQPKANTAIEAPSLTAAGPSTPRIKKEKNISESSIQVKRQIEQNVVISDSHYSDHCLKIRKMRRGEVDNCKEEPVQGGTDDAAASPLDAAGPVLESNLSTDDEDSQTTCSEECERIVNVNLGTVFIAELDEMFGRSDMTYPENIVTRVNMPISLLNEINALWIESFMYQLDQQSRQSEIMLRQDEEFARQLAQKEEQLEQAGKEPAIPDLKDIMDMELALSIYKKEVTAEWRNNEPKDLAARMTREKLYNLFPDIQPEILSELLMAHDNNFQATVEVLLSSTGNAQILEEENGVAKFITKKELERNEKLLAEQKKALLKVEWPLLPKNVKIDMNTVQEYRAKANQHLAQRNMYYQKAQNFFQRDMVQIASYYSDVAVLHKNKYDHANSLAAAALMQVHAENCTDNATIDLHYLHVPEARESLDLFLDMHIQKLREMQSKGGPRFHTLFFITGRGLHSIGGPRIKPAVKRRLRERGIAFTERNPGLLSSRVCPEDKLTHQVS